jgi:hypothetical protein
MKNKNNEIVSWKLFRLDLSEGQYVYFWVDSKNIVQFERGVSLPGWLKPADNFFGMVGESLSQLKYEIPDIKQVNHKMVDEELSKGWLLL